MSIKLVRAIQQKQNLSMTPALRKSIELLQLSRSELIAKISSKIEDNPFLINESFSEYSDNLNDYYDNQSSDETLIDHLIYQIDEMKINDRDKKILYVIIYNLNENGMLDADIEELSKQLNYECNEEEIFQNLTDIIQYLSPLGVGARDYKELIKIQLDKKIKDLTIIKIANKILNSPQTKSLEKIKLSLKTEYNERDIEKTISAIKDCDLSPGLSFQKSEYIQPDISIRKYNDDVEIKFFESGLPNLQIDEELIALTKKNKDQINKDISHKINEAKWFIRAINKRNENVFKVGKYICQVQEAFLTKTSLDLEPLTSKQIAIALKLSPSTVSRILRSKYVQYDGGIIPMKSLLMSSVSRSKKVSPLNLMREIKEIISSSNNKISDQKISIILNKRGFNLSRRTVNKYRIKSNIPNSRKR
tara:strand:- start:10934 stop:12190 length:1257 start_codon:yes stop_codon:yes gene_type:complete